jgi:hypothetical protein
LESGEGLSRFVGGHGLMSCLFEFQWNEPALEIDFRLPYARVLAEEESQKEDDAEIGAAIRMAILLLTVAAEGKLLFDGEAALFVSADEDGASYSITGPNGEMVDAGDDWASLVERLNAVISDDGDIQVIWP